MATGAPGAPQAAGGEPDAKKERRHRPSFIAKDAVDHAKRMRIAKDLAGKGFSLRQLMEFYIAKDIQEDMLTKEVVSQIVVPATSDKRCCYMESAFMMERGGPKIAQKLVSHAWDSRFLHTVLNIVLDATGWSTEYLMSKTFSLGGEGPVQMGKPMMHNLMRELEKLSNRVLESTYWLCIWAINEHKSICGDCRDCSRDAALMNCPWAEKEYAANPCLCCEMPKFNPCPCGSTKARPGSDDFELDKFAEVVKLMKCVVVSVDPSLVTLTRVWVLREVGEALNGKPCFFRLAVGMDDDKRRALLSGDDLLQPVSKCESSSVSDKEMILEEIEEMNGGQIAFNQFVSCMIDLTFGRAKKLAFIAEHAEKALRNLEHLEMDFRYRSDGLRDLAALGFGKGHMGRLCNLHSLIMNFQGCKGLTDLAPVRCDLGALPQLKKLTLNIKDTGVRDVAPLGQSLGQLKELEDCRLCFEHTGILDVETVGEGLGHLEELKVCELIFKGCPGLKDMRPIALGLAKLSKLSECVIDCSYCRGLADMADLWRSIGMLKKLMELTLNFSNCFEIEDLAPLGDSLAHLKRLRECMLDFTSCSGILDARALGRGLNGLRDLKDCTLNFSGCSGIAHAVALGAGGCKLRDLTDFRLCFECCDGITDVTEIGQGLGNLEALEKVELIFGGCANIVDVTAIGHGLGKLVDLEKCTIWFSGCKNIRDVTAIALGLGNLKRLRDVRLMFNNCKGITDVEAFGRSLGKLTRLTGCTLMFNNCKGITDVTALGNGLGNLTELKECELDFSETAITDNSAAALGCGLGNLKELMDCTLMFNNCAGLVDVSAIGHGLGTLKKLERISIDLDMTRVQLQDRRRLKGDCTKSGATFEFGFQSANRVAEAEPQPRLGADSCRRPNGYLHTQRTQDGPGSPKGTRLPNMVISRRASGPCGESAAEPPRGDPGSPLGQCSNGGNSRRRIGAAVQAVSSFGSDFCVEGGKSPMAKATAPDRLPQVCGRNRRAST